ncbi:MAG: hypothetical protein RL077_678 [Verrucomicrobiota bacterium]|jgi:hypothetical protein
MPSIHPDPIMPPSAVKNALVDPALIYDRLVADAKAKKVALVALMRKLIVLLNRSLKNPKFNLA